MEKLTGANVETNTNTFAQRLKECIEKKGMSHSKIGKEIGVAASTVSWWVTGRSKPKDDKLELLAILFECDVEWLKGVESMNAKQEESEFKRNGSGYIDPTAYVAMKSVEREENKKVFERGEVYQCILANGQERIAVILNSESRNGDKFISCIMLNDEDEKEGYVKLNCNGGVMYADCDRVTYVNNFRLERRIGFITNAELNEISAGIVKSLALESVANESRYTDNAFDRLKEQLVNERDKNKELQARLDKAIADTKSADYRASVALDRTLELERKNNTVKQADNSATVIKLETERDLYKSLYEQMLEKMIG